MPPPGCRPWPTWPSSAPSTPPSCCCTPTSPSPASAARWAGPTRAASPAASRPTTASAPPPTASASPPAPKDLQRRGPGRSSAEHAALDLAAVVLERVVQVHGGGLGGRLGIAVPDGAVDRLVLADGGGGVAAEPAQADDAGPALQHAGLADGGDEEEVVRGGGDAEVEGVVALVEFRVVAAGVAVAAGLHGVFDHP